MTERRVGRRHQQAAEISRRALLKRYAIGGVASALFLTTGSLIYSSKDRLSAPPAPTALPVPTPDPNKLMEQVILAAAQKKGATYSESEIALWKDSYIYNPGLILEISDETEALARKRIDETVELMSVSSNHYFKVNADNWTKMQTDRNLQTEWLALTNTNSAAAAVHFDFVRELVLPFGIFNLNQILNRSSAKTLAATLCQISDRLRRYFVYFDSLANDPTDPLKFEKRIVEFNRHFQNPAQISLELQSAFATEAQAYIYQVGLMGGLYDTKISRQHEIAYNFVLAGSNSNDLRWRDYVKQLNQPNN